eukprot:EC713866.1.p4 GENE.EC713866.1~~EC713866.1.p4  ORF type:complete len:89 (-),score=12.08 EC713866.1:48-314(-)
MDRVFVFVCVFVVDSVLVVLVVVVVVCAPVCCVPRNNTRVWTNECTGPPREAQYRHHHHHHHHHHIPPRPVVVRVRTRVHEDAVCVVL